jgi:N-acetylmuramic acid 6-phosphate etherase
MLHVRTPACRYFSGADFFRERRAMKRTAGKAVALSALATEAANPRSAGLEGMGALELVRTINGEDAAFAAAVRKALPQIAALVEELVPRMRSGGRLIYVGAGTSGRLGVLDASEMPPTYGVPRTWVQGIIAGGKRALTASQEGAEDDGPAGAREIARKNVGPLDTVVGLSVSGRARFVQAALDEARRRGAHCGCITCNANSPLIPFADTPIVVQTGAEVVAGSTRMKAGTAQKMVLNMLSTAAMVQLGRVSGNRMVHLQLTCAKLQERALNLIVAETGVAERQARAALKAARGVPAEAIRTLKEQRAPRRSERAQGWVRDSLRGP